MIRALREIRLLLGVELLRMWRTSEIIRFILLPALVGLPVLVFGVVLAGSMRGPRADLALPPQLPVELDLEAALGEAGFAVERREDPRAAFEAGEVDGAIVAWSEEVGIAAAGSRENAGRARWRIDVVTDERWLADELDAIAAEAGDAWLADMVVLAGGDLDADLEVARWELRKDAAWVPPFPIERGIVAYASFVLGLVAYLFLALPMVADRAEGVTETFRALPVSPARVVLARLLAMGVLQVLVVVLVVLNLALVYAPAFRSGLMPGIGEIFGIALATFLVSALQALVGVLSPTVKAAGNGASLVMFLHLGLLAWGLFGTPPPLVPIAGVLAAVEPGARWLAVAVSVGVAALVVGWTGQLLGRRVDLVLPRGGL